MSETIIVYHKVAAGVLYILICCKVSRSRKEQGKGGDCVHVLSGMAVVLVFFNSDEKFLAISLFFAP